MIIKRTSRSSWVFRSNMQLYICIVLYNMYLWTNCLIEMHKTEKIGCRASPLPHFSWIMAERYTWWLMWQREAWFMFQSGRYCLKCIFLVIERHILTLINSWPARVEPTFPTVQPSACIYIYSMYIGIQLKIFRNIWTKNSCSFPKRAA